jgi:hypothetical protein
MLAAVSTGQSIRLCKIPDLVPGDHRFFGQRPNSEQIDLATIKTDLEFAIDQISRLHRQLARAALGIIFSTYGHQHFAELVVHRPLMEPWVAVVSAVAVGLVSGLTPKVCLTPQAPILPVRRENMQPGVCPRMDCPAFALGAGAQKARRGGLGISRYRWAPQSRGLT